MVKREMRKRKCEKQPCEHQSERRRGKGGALVARADILLQPMERTIPEQIPTLQTMQEPTLGHVDILWRNCGLWRAHAETGLSWRTAAYGENPHWSRKSCCGLITAPQTHPSEPLAVEELGMKEWSWAWEKGELKGISVLSLFLTIQMYFNWQ